jgi:hypothetical protein
MVQRHASDLERHERAVREVNSEVKRHMAELRAQLARSQADAASNERRAAADLQQKETRFADLEAECQRQRAQATTGTHVAAGASCSDSSPQVFAGYVSALSAPLLCVFDGAMTREPQLWHNVDCSRMTVSGATCGGSTMHSATTTCCSPSAAP